MEEIRSCRHSWLDIEHAKIKRARQLEFEAKGDPCSAYIVTVLRLPAPQEEDRNHERQKHRSAATSVHIQTK